MQVLTGYQILSHQQSLFATLVSLKCYLVFCQVIKIKIKQKMDVKVKVKVKERWKGEKR